MKRLLPNVLAVFALAMLSACGGSSTEHEHNHGDHQLASPLAGVSKAICVLQPTTGTELKNVTGTITFTQTKNGLLVEANVTGLKPNSKHGFHVHQWGDISDQVEGMATGGHYDPTGEAEHGLPTVHEHGDHTHAMTGGHAGDFGNLETDDQGNATYTKTFENITLTGMNAVVGRAIIVHLGEDDGGQPTGNAGARVAQGVIGVANASAE